MSRLSSMVVLALVLSAGGCATVPPSQAKNFEEARRIADRTTTRYGLPRVRLFIGEVAENAAAGASASKNWIILADNVLAGENWVPILAHELGHIVLQHHTVFGFWVFGQYVSLAPREEEQLEIDANEKAVEIMTHVVGLPERDAMRRMAEFLVAANTVRGGRAIALPHGHRHPCDQFQRLVANFPQEWSADLTCTKQQGPYRGPLLGNDADLKLTR